MTLSRTLELAGKTVNRLGFGAMRLAPPPFWDPPTDPEQSIRLVRRAVDLGMNFIDTADCYSFGASEQILAEALHPYRDDVLIGTKVGQVQTRPGEWAAVGRPEFLRNQVEHSLRRLRTERIDLLQLHRVDPDVPLDDQIGELKALRDEGKIGSIGLSEVSVEQIRAARRIVEIASVQSIYNLSIRRWDDVLNYCTDERIAFIAWFPIQSGDLVKAGGPAAEIARSIGATPAQLALAWLLERSDVMVPIPGTSSIAHLEENAAAAGLALSADQVAALTATPVPGTSAW